jgi:hypothetical protein
MSKASEYQIKVREEGVYLCKIVPSLDEKGQMSQDLSPTYKRRNYQGFLLVLPKILQGQQNTEISPLQWSQDVV